jgi:serpin B
MKRFTFQCLVALLVSIGLLFVGLCPDSYANEAPVGFAEVVAGNTDFALALYGKLTDNSTGNLFFSPYSISTALVMVYAGAQGQTQTQMAETLNFTLPADRLADAFGGLQKQFVRKDTRGYQLYLANALWLQKGAPFLQGFLDLTAPFDAGRYQVDFVGETEKSCQKINFWVQEQTKNKIKDLIPPSSIDGNTNLVISNAIYFKGQWKTKFSKWKTRNSDFFVSTDHTVKVPLMHLKEKFKYHNSEKSQVLELPYKDDEMSMLVLLPKDVNGLKDVENTLTAELLNTILLKMWEPKVDVYLPRFEITWGTVSLKNALTALGMPDAFDPEKADFSGITGQKDLFISDVFHKAYVKVNEEGTEAAAATFLEVKKSASPELVFRADHPFLFLIRDNRSGSILFIGRLVNPAEQE